MLCNLRESCPIPIGSQTDGWPMRSELTSPLERPPRMISIPFGHASMRGEADEAQDADTVGDKS